MKHPINPAIPSKISNFSDYHKNIISVAKPPEQRVNVKDYQGRIINVSVNHFGE